MSLYNFKMKSYMDQNFGISINFLYNGKYIKMRKKVHKAEFSLKIGFSYQGFLFQILK